MPRPNTGVVFFGDSWVEGVGADPRTSGFAFVAGASIGRNLQVYGAGGVGYVNPGPNKQGAFSERMEKLANDPTVSLVILEGGINDLRNPSGVGKGVRQLITVTHSKYPNAQIVVLGIVPTSIEQNSSLTQLCADIRYEAAMSGAYYVSPLDERWITAANLGEFLSDDNNHPTTAGHAYIAQRLVQSLQVLSRKGQVIKL
ncbi:SGNH/GDSL hydrolase family protein [Gordonia sp. N1V]|uniref:SGNH/GDSL hydrolase family protein n=1 Tax=Gordonia sp. N1V TaxID=3034163 RepID=UPI0023E18AD5|nr:SGNH/GDSL hydrolase family protein [Gordonia sp. N1V]MDF3284673.1 SGNH/GDSL hydrolase family protein [Gordonia sp. N1V]